VLRSVGGNDFIDARDGEPDTVDCGDGTDIAVVDSIDTVTNCETVLDKRPPDRPAPVIPTPPQPTAVARRPIYPLPGPTTPPATDPPATPPADIHLRLVVSAVSLRTARTAGLPVRASCGAGCRVNAVVRVTAQSARRLRIPRTLAHGTRTGASDGTARLRMRLRGGRLAQVGRVHVTIHAEAVTAAGQHLVQDVELTLRR
jgi:hypothetical protein